MKTIQIKNDSGSVRIWAGKEFAVDEVYTVPTDVNRYKWQNNSALMTAIGNADALIGDGGQFFSDVNEAMHWLLFDLLIDSSTGAVAFQPQIAPNGWQRQNIVFEYETSKLGSVHECFFDGTSMGWTSIKFFNAGGTELTTQLGIDLSCVRTEVTWSPPIDYAIKGISCRQAITPISDHYLWVQALPDIPNESGGEIVFIEGGANLAFISPLVAVGSEAEKAILLPYNGGAGTNVFKFLHRHVTGHRHKLQVIMTIYREQV